MGLISFLNWKKKEKKEFIIKGDLFTNNSNMDISITREYYLKSDTEKQIKFSESEEKYFKSLSSLTAYRKKTTKRNPTKYGADFYEINFGDVISHISKYSDEWFYIYSYLKDSNNNLWKFKDCYVKCDTFYGVKEFFTKNLNIINNLNPI